MYNKNVIVVAVLAGMAWIGIEGANAHVGSQRGDAYVRSRWNTIDPILRATGAEYAVFCCRQGDCEYRLIPGCTTSIPKTMVVSDEFRTNPNLNCLYHSVHLVNSKEQTSLDLHAGDPRLGHFGYKCEWCLIRAEGARNVKIQQVLTAAATLAAKERAAIFKKTVAQEDLIPAATNTPPIPPVQPGPHAAHTSTSSLGWLRSNKVGHQPKDASSLSRHKRQYSD